ncbi:unnamed protein product [Eruca vesicaria subsp. sativa]|uniref:Uncharacterized protein n=1 Tax=Eruca vesicaria subsp. sativa TaxID=29727 RepID=A0ABC8LSS0_ERUVS|nr:unnamed protein product [Eruca vesicaria subsp. sativa]
MYTRKPRVKNKQAMDHAIDPCMSFGNIMKEAQRIAKTNMTWKDNKALENQKDTEFGGKPRKKQRLPLKMKEKRRCWNRKLKYNSWKFGGQFGGTSTKKPVEKKRKQEERVLKSTFGNFRGGVLYVKDLQRSGGSSSSGGDYNFSKNKSKSKGMGGDLGGGGEDIKKIGTRLQRLTGHIEFVNVSFSYPSREEILLDGVQGRGQYSNARCKAVLIT